MAEIVSQRITDNLADVRGRMQAACVRAGRSSSEVQLIAVTKSVDVAACRALYDLGERHFAENRVDVAGGKISALADAAGICWHMIGNIQRRKAREVAQLFDVVDAVDRVELAEALQRRLEGTEKQLPILLEINVSGEASKHGLPPEEVASTLAALRAFDRLLPRGLMTMAPFDAPEAEIRAYFRRLKALTQDHGLPECSMGMTNDYEIAIEEGATQVRIGSALFA